MRDPDTIKGKARKNVGAAKQIVGDVTGDTETKAEGTAERAKGNVQEAYGKTKEAIRGARRGVES